MQEQEPEFGRKSIHALVRKYPSETFFGVGMVAATLFLAQFSAPMAIAMIGAMFVDAHLQLWSVCEDAPALLLEERVARGRAEVRAKGAEAACRAWAARSGRFTVISLDDPRLN